MTTDGTDPLLPTPRTIWVARLLSSIVPLGPEDVLLVGRVEGFHGTAAVLHARLNRAYPAWTRFAGTVMDACGVATRPEPAFLVTPDEDRCIHPANDLLRAFTGEVRSPSMNRLVPGRARLLREWKRLVASHDGVTGDASSPNTEDRPAWPFPAIAPPVISRSKFLTLMDESVVRALFEPCTPSAHERLAFESRLRLAGHAAPAASSP